VPGGVVTEQDILRFDLLGSVALSSNAVLRAIAASEQHLAFVVNALLCVYVWDKNVRGSCQAMPKLVSNVGPDLQLGLMDGIVFAAAKQPDSDNGPATASRVAGVIVEADDYVMVDWNTPQSIAIGSDERIWLLQGPLCKQNVRRQTGRACCGRNIKFGQTFVVHGSVSIIFRSTQTINC
jgi:hypothetical protein